MSFRYALIAILAAMGVLAGADASRAADKPLAQGNLLVVELPAEERARRGIEAVALGELDLPTGRVVVADPLANPDRPALAREVPKGRYPVTLFRAQSRIAMAMVRFAPGKVARWEMATIPGQDPAELKGDEIFGYPVDAGTGAFMDAAAKPAMDKREQMQIEKQRAAARQYSNYYDDVVSAEMERNGGDYALHKPLDDDPANVAIFRSGWGDGFYASYWGLDEADRPLALVTDFVVMEGADGRDEHMKRHDAIVAAMPAERREANHALYAAYKAGDAARLASLLASGRVGPDDYLIDAHESCVMLAIRQDKPAMLETLIRYGAVLAMRDHDATLHAEPTYPAYARWLAEEVKKDEMAARRKENGYGPLSVELLGVIDRWEAGRIPLAPDAPKPGKRP